MELVFINSSGEATQRKYVNDDVEPRQLVKDLMEKADPLYIKVCHGVSHPERFLAAADKAWEIEVLGVHQQTGEPTVARFTRNVKVG